MCETENTNWLAKRQIAWGRHDEATERVREKAAAEGKKNRRRNK